MVICANLHTGPQGASGGRCREQQMPMLVRMNVPQGSFDLRRYPDREQSTLRAWDAADEYLLEHYHSTGEASDGGSNWHDGSALILNDSFGAVATALAANKPYGRPIASMSDSLLSHLGLGESLTRNGIDRAAVAQLSSLDDPSPSVDHLLVKIPRSLALLEDELLRVRPALAAGAVVIGAGMTKLVHTSTLELFERIIGPTTTSRAKKKARLIFAELDEALAPGPSPYPTTYKLESGHEMVNHANVFSRAQLDSGARLLLENLPDGLGEADVVDLGCGNGVIGHQIALDNPDARLTFVDASYMAVESARESWERSFGADRPADFEAADSLTAFAPDSVDLVVTNPPFHEDRAVGDAVAWQMFSDARRCLRPGGRLIVVGNQHLGYHAKLKRLFGGNRVLASNPKFVVVVAEVRARR